MKDMQISLVAYNELVSSPPFEHGSVPANDNELITMVDQEVISYG
jgi:hypothetical protein